MSTLSSDLVKTTKADCTFFLFIIFYVGSGVVQNEVDLVVVLRNGWMREVFVVIGLFRISRKPMLFDSFSTANTESNCEGKEGSKYTSKYNDQFIGGRINCCVFCLGIQLETLVNCICIIDCIRKLIPTALIHAFLFIKRLTRVIVAFSCNLHFAPVTGALIYFYYTV
jgi:hypothetical protein